MAEFEYNLLIVHSDQDVQEFLLRLFDGNISGRSEKTPFETSPGEFIGRIDISSGDVKDTDTRKIHIRTANSAVDYEKHWKHHHQDVVLLNLFVPVDDQGIPSKDVGLQLLKRIKGVDTEAEVIVLSDQIFQDEAIEAIKCGAFYFIPQPQIQGIFVRTLVSQIIKGREAKYVSNLDGLTGLHNRQFFDLMLKREIDSFGESTGGEDQRQIKHLSLMLIDMDRFKLLMIPIFM